VTKITIHRTVLMTGEGVLTLENDGDEILSTKSWEHAGNLIPPKTYTGCSKTTMANSGRPGIYLPDEQTGKTGIFIHAGTSQSNSKGCICIQPDQMQKLLANVPSQNGAITVVVTNPAK